MDRSGKCNVNFEFHPTILIDDGLVTSVINFGWTVIVGTNNGQLLKFHLKKRSHGGKVLEYYIILLY